MRRGRKPPPQWETGYLSSLNLCVAYCDEAGNPLGTLLRGTQVEYEIVPDGRLSIHLNDATVYVQDEATVVADLADIIPVPLSAFSVPFFSSLFYSTSHSTRIPMLSWYIL